VKLKNTIERGERALQIRKNETNLYDVSGGGEEKAGGGKIGERGKKKGKPGGLR